MAKEKWQTLQHNGVLFPAEYEYKNFDSNLSPLAEEMLYHYAAKMNTDYVKNETFNKNFWLALKPELPKSYQEKQLKDFSTLIYNMYKYIQQIKEEKKIANKKLTKQQKEKIKLEKDEIKTQYGHAILNGKKQPLGMYQIEPPGILITRGANPLLGCWKYRVKPEGVTLNHSLNLNPPCGNWKIIENKNSMELATYDIKTSGKKVLHKRILFSAVSDVKQGADQKKFAKAIKLLKNWEKVENHIYKNINSKNHITKQAAMVSYLIMNLGIRVGDEKDTDIAADTVGASSLRKEHLTLNGNTLSLSFLGKDSVKYENTIEIDPRVTKVLNEFIETEENKMLFPDISSGDINKFLKEVVNGISAKVFRTAHGSFLLAENLRVKVPENATIAEKIAIFNEANRKVAVKLNHQRNVAKNAEQKEKEYSEKIAEKEAKLSELRMKNSAEIEKLKKQIDNIDKSLTKDTQKHLKETITKKIDKLTAQLVKANQKLQEFKMKIDFKNGTKDIALGTSKSSYSSPKVVISWCKDKGVPIEKIYTKTLQKKFEWAMDTDETYYKKYPNVKD